ncbi:CaiB/BaiF CoA-transferase family protein [Streptomyces sp. AcE210]|uniref:CaiB/BaiF CoA transferase family protein n=1 Tax=Streptomyces sp. AcE210 TaxID=2292703 RepID=UPI000E302A1F|nr:CaiB/BaiF CoA-transferase family protein [Streptomyces sp. AcE210]RFC76617.1 CoA transferase [Streptomyces sp. AcE210]
MSGPLAGVKVVELGGIGPGPFCAMVLGDLGADVVRVDRPAEAGSDAARPVMHRNRRSVTADLKNPEGVEVVRTLADGADILIEGFRPGVTERLGLGPDELLARNPRLVYGRMTGWGQDGPMAQEPGHDIDYIALSGALHTIGPADGDPVPPLNLVGDFGGGGMLLAVGVLSAVLNARSTGRGQVVDAAMTDGSALLLSMMYGFLATGRWTDERGSNFLDGTAPYYRAYRCADGGHVAVGPVEPQFYASLLRVLGLSHDPDFAGQNDRAKWPVMTERLAAVFATRTRDEWAKEFAGQEACVAPVLSLTEAPHHPHNAARGTYLFADDGLVEPAPAPRFSDTPAAVPVPSPVVGAHTDEVLAEAGFDAGRITALRAAGAVR